MPAPIQAVFFDVDGTLISFNTHKIPDSTRRALHEMRRRGVKVFIASGRPPVQMGFLRQLADFEFDGYIAMNGQYCYDAKGPFYQLAIPTDSIRQLLPWLEQTGLSCSFVELEYEYINRITPQVLDLYRMLGDTIAHEPVDDPARALTHTTYQISAYLPAEQEAEFLAHLPGCKAARWNPHFADIIPAAGGKPVGVQQMLDRFGIDRAASMAFGDGGNDSDMLQYAAVGVAMDNAGDDVKAAADYVTAGVDEDGVERALRHFGVI